MKVPRYNYAAQFGGTDSPDNVGQLLQKVRNIFLSGDYILTDDVVEFEQSFARFLEVGHVRGVNTGTDALVVAMLALDIGRGDEVITQANTFNATVAAICLVGATPVLVDAEEDSFGIDTRQLGAAVTSRTKALLPVHLYGLPAEMSSVLEVAERHGLWVIEDAAQAVGAYWRDQRVGGIGNVGCFSFHPSKNLAAAGDAGAVVTNDRAIDERLRQFRELGQCGQNNHSVVGLNTKLDAIQAIVLSAKLPNLDKWNSQRRTIAQMYRERLADLDVNFQTTAADDGSVYHLFQLRTSQRDDLLRFLQSAGIDAVVRYPTPIHMQEAFASCGWRNGQFPVAERLAAELLCLPMRPDMGIAEIDTVTDEIWRFFKGAS